MAAILSYKLLSPKSSPTDIKAKYGTTRESDVEGDRSNKKKYLHTSLS